MTNLKNSLRFIIKSPFHSLVVLLAVTVSISVQFLILSIGSLLDTMILDQTTSYQDHIIVSNYVKQNTNYNNLDFNILSNIKSNDPNVNYANYFLEIDGDITEIDNTPISPSIRLNFHAYNNNDKSDDFIKYVGLDNEQHLIGNSTVMDTSRDEIMLDVTYAKLNNLDIGQTITYKNNITNNLNNFKIVGIYDLGIFRKNNNFTYIDLDKFTDLSSSKFSINIQLKKTIDSNSSLEMLKTYLNDDKVQFKTWEDQIPEISVLNKAQKIVILLIEVFISGAFFIVILSVLNYSVKKKHPQFGILKAQGQSNRDIRRTLALKAFIITMVGTVIGLSFGTLGVKIYENSMIYSDGSKRFNINLSYINYLIPILLTTASALFASFFSYIRVRRFTIIELIKEK